MLEIFIFALGIMYTPGPVNFIAILQGLQGRTRQFIPFCIGVGTSMAIHLSLLGYTSAKIVPTAALPYISAAGCLYIVYLGIKIWKSDVDLDESIEKSKDTGELTFWNGLIMQSLNPKAFIATVPLTTIQYPAAGLEGISILYVSIILGCMAGGAPTTYALIGSVLGKTIRSSNLLALMNKALAVLLFYTAFSIGYDSIYLALI